MNTFNELEENYYPYELNQNYKIIEPFNGVTIQNDKIIEHFPKLSRAKNFGAVTDAGSEALSSKILTKAKSMLKTGQSLDSDTIIEMTRRYQKLYKAQVGNIDVPDPKVLGKNKQINEITNILKKQAQQEMDQIFKKLDDKLVKELEANANKLVKKTDIDISPVKEAKTVTIRKIDLKKLKKNVDTKLNDLNKDADLLSKWSSKEITEFQSALKLTGDIKNVKKNLSEFKKSINELDSSDVKIKNFNKSSKDLVNNIENLDKDLLKQFIKVNHDGDVKAFFKKGDNFEVSQLKGTKTGSKAKKLNDAKMRKFIQTSGQTELDLNDFFDNISTDDLNKLINNLKTSKDNTYFEQIKYISNLKVEIKSMTKKIENTPQIKGKIANSKLNKLKELDPSLVNFNNNKISINFNVLETKNNDFMSNAFKKLKSKPDGFPDNFDDLSPKQFNEFYSKLKKGDYDDLKVDAKQLKDFKEINDGIANLNGEARYIENVTDKKITKKINDMTSKNTNLKETNKKFNQDIFTELKKQTDNFKKLKKSNDAKLKKSQNKVDKLQGEVDKLRSEINDIQGNNPLNDDVVDPDLAKKQKLLQGKLASLSASKNTLNDELNKKVLFDSILDKNFGDLGFDEITQLNKYISELDGKKLTDDLKNLVDGKKELSELLNSTANGRKLLKNAEFEADMDFINAKFSTDIKNIELEFDLRKKSLFERFKSFFTKKPDFDKKIKENVDELDGLSKQSDKLTKKIADLRSKQNPTSLINDEIDPELSKLLKDLNDTEDLINAKIGELTTNAKINDELFDDFFNIIKDSRKTELSGEKDVAKALRNKIKPSETELANVDKIDTTLAKKQTVIDTAANMKPEKAKSRFKRAGEYLKAGGSKIKTVWNNNKYLRYSIYALLLGGVVTGVVTLINWSESTSKPPPPSPESSTPSAEWLCKNRINPITNQNYANCKEEEDTEKTCKSTKNPKLEDNKTYTSCSEMVSEENKCKNTTDPYTGFNYKDCADLEGKEKACKAINHPNDTRQICPKCPLMYSTKSLKGKSSDNDETTYFGLTQSCECLNTELEDKEVFYSSCQNKKDEEYCMSKVNIIYNKQYLSCRDKNLVRSGYELDPSGDISGIDRTQMPKTTTDAYLRSYKVKLLWGLTQDEVIEEAERLRMEENNPELADVIVDFWLSYQSLEDDQKQIFLAMTVAEQITTLLSSKGIKINEDGVAVDANDDGEMDEFELDDEDEDEDYSSNIMNQQNYNNINNLNRLNNQQNNIQKKSSKSLLYIAIGAGVLFFLLILILILKK